MLVFPETRTWREDNVSLVGVVPTVSSVGDEGRRVPPDYYAEDELAGRIVFDFIWFDKGSLGALM